MAQEPRVGDRSARFDLVLETSGASAARDQALEVVAAQGVVLWVGESDEPWTIQESRAIRRKDFFLVRSFYFPKRDHTDNVQLLMRRRDEYARLVDRVFDLAAMPEEFPRFMQGGSIKPLMRGGA